MRVEPTPIPGMLLVHLDVFSDTRGWFKENWQREKMLAVGIPDFSPVQNNMSFNTARGTTRGFHAEPWDKLVSVATGRVFAAWVDLREGLSFGATFWTEIGPETAVFVPRGISNAYQSLADSTSYCYLVNDHWRPEVRYPALELQHADVPWPISLAESVISEKDRDNPPLGEVAPFPAPRALILGANGQLGRALQLEFPTAKALSRKDCDIARPEDLAALDWSSYDLVLNAAAYTAVDSAEADRLTAWSANASAVAALTQMTATRKLTLVHYSTDYVFDGTEQSHVETEPLSPLGVYGQSKAAGELALAANPRHYCIRTSWVVGDGNNFVRMMTRLAETGVAPTVVGDQFGRLTFAEEIAKATHHLVRSSAPFGTYHVSQRGPVQSWADIAREVFSHLGHDPGRVREVTSAEYFSGRSTIAPRPRYSTFDLTKIQASGFHPRLSHTLLPEYLASSRTK